MGFFLEGSLAPYFWAYFTLAISQCTNLKTYRGPFCRPCALIFEGRPHWVFLVQILQNLLKKAFFQNQTPALYWSHNYNFGERVILAKLDIFIMSILRQRFKKFSNTKTKKLYCAYNCLTAPWEQFGARLNFKWFNWRSVLHRNKKKIREKICRIIDWINLRCGVCL